MAFSYPNRASDEHDGDCDRDVNQAAVSYGDRSKARAGTYFWNL